MNSNLVLKRVNNKDLSLIEEILKGNDLVYEDIKDKNIELFSAFKEGVFVGIIGLEWFEHLGLLRSLAVLEEHRNKGYGKEICDSLLNYAKDKRIKEIYLLTVTARKFFEKIGFNLVERKYVPDEIKNTAEFLYFCPSSATCMRIYL